MTAIGRVGGEARVKTVGKRVVINFSIATNKRKVNKETGETTEEVKWINCALWRDEAGTIAQYLKKGQQVYVQGEPEWRVFKKADKTPGIDTSLTVVRLELVGGKKEDSGSPTPDDSDTDYKWDEETTPELEEAAANG